METPEGREELELCGREGWCLLRPGYSSWSVWLWNGSKVARWPGKDRGWGGSLLTRVCFLSECFWILSRAWVREGAATGHQAFGWGLWRSSEPCLAGRSRQGFLPRSVWAPDQGARGARGRGKRGFVCQRRGGLWCSAGSRFDLSDLWRLFAPCPPPPLPRRFGSRIAGPNGESGSATSRPSCARTASARSLTGSCSPTTTCTRAIRTTTGPPRASRRPPCPPRASLSSTR